MEMQLPVVQQELLNMDDLIGKIEVQVKLGNTRIEEQIRRINARISGLKSAKTTSEEELKLTETIIDELNLTKRLQQEWKSTKTRNLETLKRIYEDDGHNSTNRGMKLEFRNKIPQSILTGEEIKGDEDTSIEVALVDSMDNNIVEIGQESSAKVEIVVLSDEVEDDLTGEEFKDKIVPEMEGKKPLLKGNVYVKLRRGRGFLDKISFRHRRGKTKPLRFRLGARIVVDQIFDGVRVKEAMTEPFTVKDYRRKYYRKHKYPLLSDEVCRLVNIWRGGKIAKDLKENNIETVKDFLIRLLINPQGLKNIVKLRPKQWEATVDNARACQNDSKMYCYIDYQQKMGVVFNVLGEILGLYANNHYTTTTVLSENHKAAQELLSSAYSHWDDVKTINDQNALEKHFTGLSTPDSLMPDYPGEIVRESDFSAQSISLAMNLCTESGHNDLISSFSIDYMEPVGDDFSQPSTVPQSTYNLDPLLLDFDYWNANFNDHNWHSNSLINETAFAYGESEVVEMRKRPKRWKKLLCVSRVFSISKNIASGGNHNRKKQRIC